MKIGHLFNALGWAREEERATSSSRGSGHLDPYFEPSNGNGPRRVSSSSVQRSAPRNFVPDSFENNVKIDTNAVFRLASRKYDPRNMTREEGRRLASLLFEAGVITRRDQRILADGPTERFGTMQGEDYDALDMVSAWQGRLHKYMASHDFSGVDMGSRALTILGRVVAAGGQRA